MFNDRATAVVLGALTLASHLPTANAFLSWDFCTKDADGKTFCKDRVPRGARIAIAIVCLLVIILLLTLCTCIIKNRRATAAQEKEYNVEASQMQGPPTIIATEYNPHSGPSPVYDHSGLKSGHFEIGHLSPVPLEMSGPAVPATAHYYVGSNDWKHDFNTPPEYAKNQTAPVHQVNFPYQPQPRSPTPPGLTAPRTAAGYAFPRPLLAGNRLKDRLKERPASVSSMSSTLVEGAGRGAGR